MVKQSWIGNRSSAFEAARLVCKLAALACILFFIFVVYLSIFAGSPTGPFYERFTSPRQPSMILGTSRAAKGMVPSVFNESDLTFARPLYNFSFTNSSSPFGPTYAAALEKKLSATPEAALFLIEVNPRALSVGMEERESPESALRETENLLARMNFFNTDPNPEFILRHYSKPYYRIAAESLRNLQEARHSWTELHPNGWMKAYVDVSPSKVQARVENKIERYTAGMKQEEISDQRLQSLGETIDFLSAKGSIYLVRLPSSRPMYKLEREMVPDFDSVIEELASRHSVPYLNYAGHSSEFISTDGTHLYRSTSVRVSKMILSDIERERRPPPASGS